MGYYVKHIIFLLLFFLGGCTEEEDLDKNLTEPVSLQIKMNALDSNIKVRIIIANAKSGEIISNDYPLDLSDVYIKQVPTGLLNIYILGNEFSRLESVLSNIRNDNQLLPLTVLYDELPDTEIPTPPELNASNLPLMKKIPVQVRVKDSDPEQGEVSMDNGVSWSETLDATVERLAVKVSLAIRKITPDERDEVTIEKVQLLNSPLYSYWIPQTYTETDFYSPKYIYNDESGITFTDNADESDNDNYTTVFEQHIIPEYKPADPYLESTATTLKIFARYNGEEKTYSVLLRNKPNSTDFSLERNTSHTMKVTIVNGGDIVTRPEILYEVSEWDEAYNPFEDGKSVVFTREWKEGLNINGKDIYVSENDELEFRFKLTSPRGATWSATLTNSVNFTFDYSGEAVSSGIASGNLERIIRIIPRRGVRRNNVKTEFYITINYGNENVELDLVNGNVGSGNRYIINQIPAD